MTRILHLSDTHLHAPGARTLHPEIDTRARLEQVVDRVRAYGPFDAVVVTGDVCDDGSEVGALAVREAVEGLAPVILAVPGNHDHAAPVRAAFGVPVAEVGPWHVVGADTHVEGEVAGDAAGALGVLAGIGDRPAVLLMHHPVASRSTHEWFVLRGREELVRALESHTAPLVVLSGHTHEPYEARLGDAYLLGAPATYYSIRHDGPSYEFLPARFGAAVVTLDDERFVPSVDVVMLTDPAMQVEDRLQQPTEGI